jgi:hypothetical protein
MKYSIKIKQSNLSDGKFFKNVLIVLDAIALIGFFLNITITDFVNILTSKTFWFLIPKSFIILLPFLEFLFISFLSEDDLNKKLYKKIYPYTFILLLATGLILKLLFDFSIYDEIILEWWIGSNSYQAVLLSIILLLSLGFVEINFLNLSINFYYYIDSNGRGYSIGGLIIANKKTGGRMVMGAPSITSSDNKP